MSNTLIEFAAKGNEGILCAIEKKKKTNKHHKHN